MFTSPLLARSHVQCTVRLADYSVKGNQQYKHDLQSDCWCSEVELASYPGSSQFFNDPRRKTREPSKSHHIHDVHVEGERDLVQCAQTQSFSGILLREA